MSVRKRSWTTAMGEIKEAWIVDYTDQDGDRHIETFKRKKEADAFHAQVCVDVRDPYRAVKINHRQGGGRGLDQVRSVGKA